ncbi:DUF4312 family protein [Orbus mooreae]|uniref:DUF4312 family protein n=1 Tax=Orbus mooreae TaxID=3074107 RepID=UPI00370DD935
MKQNEQMTVRVKGSGNSKQKALATALSQVQREVLKNSSTVLLRIEPLDIQVVTASAKISTEKFLFFFLPRKKEHYEITVDVVVDVTFVEINKIEFVTK